MFNSKALVLFFLITFLAGCSENESQEQDIQAREFLIAPSSYSSYTPVFLEGQKPDPDLYGIWHSNGYGFILEITPEKIVQYLETSSFCYPETEDPELVEEIFKYRLVEAPGDDLYLTMFPGSAVYNFKPLAGLPEKCSFKENWSGEEVFEVFAEYFGENFAFFERRGIDWPAEVNKARDMLGLTPGDESLFEAFSYLIGILEDPHTELLEAYIGEEEVSANAGLGKTRQALKETLAENAEEEFSSLDISWLQDFRKRIAENLLNGKGHRVGRGQIDWGEIDEDIGYIQFLTFATFSREEGIDASLTALHEVLDEAISSLSEKKAIIVDATQNRGGIDVYAWAAVGHFANERHLVFTKDNPGASAPKTQAFYVEVEGEQRYQGQIYFVTSDVTVSAGESFTLAMRSLPNVTHVGTRTRGALSDELARMLPNGWYVGLSSEVVLDAKGESFEISGIPPDVEYQIFDTENLFSDAHIEVIRKIATDIKAGLLTQK